VVEIVLGALIGPDVFSFADRGDTLDFLGQLGLGFLFFFAGYEIQFDRIAGAPLRLALLGWMITEALLLVAFVAVAVLAATVASGAVGRHWAFIERHLETSGQVPVRFTVLLLFAPVVIASDLGLDVILGAFAAGLIVRLILRGREVELFESKLDAVGFGLLIPFFFITSEIALDLEALVATPRALLELPVFLALFLIVRGLPALLLYRGELDGSERRSLALLCSTQLPLVVAIATIGVEHGHMRSSTAAALGGAGVLSVLILPSLAIARPWERMSPRLARLEPG
jgi:Kef-type K+ transport system membrane component KefB